jgi:F420-dependent oxidoreductase-like protein
MLRAPIRLGLQIPNFNFPGVSEGDLFECLSDIATTAESSGFDTVLVMDHLHQIRGVGPPENWMLEGNTILPALAARTNRVNLSLLVGATTYRNPALHAKITTTLDVISGGRAIHGIGAGWNVEEAESYGYEFPSLGERFERLEDHLNIVRAMFTQEPATYEGKHHSVHEAFNNPKPIRGDIPIMIGGSGEKKTLRMVAQYADASNFFGDADRLRHLIGVLEAHCERLGRDPAEITTTRLGTIIIAETQEEADAKLERLAQATGMDPDRRAMVLTGDPDTVAEKTSELLETGINGLIFNSPEVHDLETVQLLGETLGPLCSDVPSGRSSVG